jgi:hypothetical protein
MQLLPPRSLFWPIADIAYYNKAVTYGILFKAAAETLITIAADPKHLGARIGLTAVLRSWTVSPLAAFRTPASVPPLAPAPGGHPKTLNDSGRSRDRNRAARFDPSRSLSFALGTALPAPKQPFARVGETGGPSLLGRPQ